MVVQDDIYASNARHVVSVVTIFTAIALVTLCLRIYTRAVIVKRIAHEDWFIIAAMVIFLSHANFIVLGLM